MYDQPILVAFPEKWLGAICQQYLERQGYKVSLASNAQECWKQFRDRKPEVLVIARNFSWTDFPAALHRICGGIRSSCVPVIVLADQSDPSFEDGFPPELTTDCLQAPVRLSELARAVDSAVVSRAQLAEAPW